MKRLGLIALGLLALTGCQNGPSYEDQIAAEPIPLPRTYPLWRRNRAWAPKRLDSRVEHAHDEQRPTYRETSAVAPK